MIIETLLVIIVVLLILLIFLILKTKGVEPKDIEATIPGLDEKIKAAISDTWIKLGLGKK